MLKDVPEQCEVPAESLESPRHRPTCRCSIDIGGTLAKIVYYEEDGDVAGRQEDTDDDIHSLRLSSHDESRIFCSEDTGRRAQHGDQRVGGTLLRFKFFRTVDIDHLLCWLKEKSLVQPGYRLPITGGGAFKFEHIFRDQLNLHTVKQDEMESAIAGLAFLISTPGEVRRYDTQTKTAITYDMQEPVYPFLLVNIGSGVSVLMADSPTSFKRITGTCIGGGTVLGLARLLLGVSTFDEVVAMSRRGSNALDLVVSDLYGDAAGSRCLPGDTLASSFGRLYVERKCSPLGTARRDDIARSLVTMVSYNLGYLAFLIGTIHKVTRFFFTGKFINNHDVTMEAITKGVHFYASQYCSQRPSVTHTKSSAGGVPLRHSCHLVCPPVPSCGGPPRHAVSLSHHSELGARATEYEFDQCSPSTAYVNEDPLRIPSHNNWTAPASCQPTPNVSQPNDYRWNPKLTNPRPRTSWDDPLNEPHSPSQYHPGGETEAVSRDVIGQRQEKQSKLDGPSSKVSATALPSHCPGSLSESSTEKDFKVLFLKHDGYLGSLGALILARQVV